MTVIKITKWLEQGKDVRQIALLWNQGSSTKCRSGINSSGVKYNSCQYADLVVVNYKNQ